MNLPNNRVINFTGAFICASSLVIAVVYFQQHLGLEPCYLCITQRAFVAAVGVIFLLGAIHNPQGTRQKIYPIGSTIAALCGGYFSAKQIWLQNLPEENIPVCGPPVDYLFDVFPASEVIGMLIRGDGNCAKVQWELLGFSMPEWVLLIFIILAGLGLVQLLRKD